VRDDEAAAVRAFWRTLRDNVAEPEVPLYLTLSTLARNATRLGLRAREVEEPLAGPPGG
jgi:hypothetical protein